MFNQHHDETKFPYSGDMIPVFLPSQKREEGKDKLNIVEDSHQCQRVICHISPFFKETALNISSIISDHVDQLLERQLLIASQVGKLLIKKLRDYPLKFSSPRDKLDRYLRVLTLVATTQEVSDQGMQQKLTKVTECLQQIVYIMNLINHVQSTNVTIEYLRTLLIYSQSLIENLSE